MPEVHLTEQLAAWLSTMTSDDVPATVRDEASLRMLDSVGVALAARNQPGIIALLRQVPSVSPERGVPVFGHDRFADVRDAALANGTMAHALDFDDSVLPSRIHPSAGLTAGLLALGHHWDTSGRELVLGFVTGFEVIVRLADAIHPAAYEAGWHNAGLLTPLGVAAGGAVMKGADAATIEHALGIAASQSGGLLGNKGSMTKALHTGRGAWSGVLSALLALDGFTSRPGGLDDRPGGGFVRLVGGDPAQVEVATLGVSWSVLRSAIKPYACGVVAHPAIDAAIQFRRDGIGAADVRRLSVWVPGVALELMGDHAPRGGLEAKFSLPFVVAAALVHGHGNPSLFEGDQVLEAAEVRRLMSLTDVIADESLSQEQARMSVETADGRTHDTFVGAALGSRANPVSADGIREKFLHLGGQGDDPGRSAAIVQVLGALDDHTTRQLTALL